MPLSFRQRDWYSSGDCRNPRNWAAITRLVKLLVMTRLRSLVPSSRAITCTWESPGKLVASLPFALQVSTRCRSWGSNSNSNASAPTLSGLSPDRANETTSPGRSRGRALTPWVSNTPPPIARVFTESSFCNASRTQWPAYSELPEPVSTRFLIPARQGLKPEASNDICSAVWIQLEGCWKISRRVWKYPRLRCSSSGAPSNLAASGWRSQTSRSQSEKAIVVLNVTPTSLSEILPNQHESRYHLPARLQLRSRNIHRFISPQQGTMPKAASE